MHRFLNSSSLALIHFNCFGARISAFAFYQTGRVITFEALKKKIVLLYVHEVSQKLRQQPDRAGSALLANNARPYQVRVRLLVRGKKVL